MGAGWRLWWLSWLSPCHFGGGSWLSWHEWVQRTLVYFVRIVMSAFDISFVDLHGTLGSSYLRDALPEGSVDVVACLPDPRA
jgi:hypothetical protein